MIRASCRSDGRIDLAHALDACGDLFVRHGGHAAAAGFELPADRWDAFVERFLVVGAAAAPEDPRRPLNVDLALPARPRGLRAVPRPPAARAVRHRQPGARSWRRSGMTVQRVRAANGGHTQLVLRRERDVVDGIAFGRPDLAESIHEGDRVDVVARLASRTFGGLETLQLEIRDVATSGTHPRAAEVLARAAGGAGATAVPVERPDPAGRGAA